MTESFASLLKRYRIAAGLSQERLAELAAVSADAISTLERGARRAPYKATLDLLIAALPLDDRERRELEEAAALGRVRGPQTQRTNALADESDEFLPHNLPPQLTSFVDREKEVAEIKELLQSCRLVTLVGTGGSGKTRCAVRVARGLLDDYGDDVAFAELAAISDPVLVSGVIARALRVREAAHHPILDSVLAYLKRKRLLLILDNCEHVIDEARRVTAAILDRCPNVHILTTSRETFTISGEQAYHMQSLPAPSEAELLSAEEISQYAAVQLFCDRAVASDNRFILTFEIAPYVADICRRLDGIPLAIELAAARVKTLSPKQLDEKLDERLRLLVTADHTAMPRHRTMRALIDWSYDLLSESERRLFRCLSIFAGAFTLEMAAAVCAINALDEIATLHLLSSLVNKSLVQAEPSVGTTRFRLLESTREYAREKLSDSGEKRTVASAHARVFLKLADELRDAWETTPDRVWLARAESELENFEAALGWALGDEGHVVLGQQLAGALYGLWRYFPAAARRWLEAAQRLVDAGTPSEVIAALDLTDAWLMGLVTHHKASLAAAERALQRFRELADRYGIAAAELRIGGDQIFLGRFEEGETRSRRALEEFRALGARRSEVHALHVLALARQFAGDLHGARHWFGEALSAARALGAEQSAANIALDLAEVHFRSGDARGALQLVNEALPVFRAFGLNHNVAIAQSNMAAHLVSLHRYDEARVAAREALALAREADFSVLLAFALQHLAAIAALREKTGAQLQEERRLAARILGHVSAQLSVLDKRLEFTEKQEFDTVISSLTAALGEEELVTLMGQGSTWPSDRAVAEALEIP